MSEKVTQLYFFESVVPTCNAGALLWSGVAISGEVSTRC